MTRALVHIASALMLSLLITLRAGHADELNIPVSDDNEVTVERFAAGGEYVIIWLAPEYGFRKAHTLFALQLAKQKIEVWQLNIAESLFLPLGTDSIKSLDGRYIADVIEQAHRRTGKKVLIAGDSYGALSALKAAHAWQRKPNKDADFIGAILFSPYTYAAIPPLGLAPEYMPEVSATTIPLLIYQAKDSGTFGNFSHLMEKLQANGSPVYTMLVPEVMSLFYKEEPSEAMLRQAKPLPHNIAQMVKILEKHEPPATPVPLALGQNNSSGLDSKLQEYKGNKYPPDIRLEDINGNMVLKRNFKNKVTVVNFWATWCPPCIEEIPSLNRLRRSLQDMPFELITINYAENRDEVVEFMRRVEVEFTVLMDRNGEYAKQWHVVAYPSTFLIGPDGTIKYGVNSAIEWDTPEIKQQIIELIKEH